MPLQILQSAPNDPKPNSRNRASKVPYIIMCTVLPGVPNFRPFGFMISRFGDSPHFPLTPILKFQCATTFLIFWADHQNNHNFIFPYDCRIYHKVWLRSDEKFPDPYGSVLAKMSKCYTSTLKHLTFLNVGRSPKTVIAWIPSWPLAIKFGWNWLKTVGTVAFWNLNIWIAKCTEWPQNKLKQSSGITSTLPVCTVVHRVPNFRQFRCTISRFQDIAHIRIFPLPSMQKFQSAINFLILADHQYIP